MEFQSHNLIGWCGNYLTWTGLPYHKPLSFTAHFQFTEAQQAFSKIPIATASPWYEDGLYSPFLFGGSLGLRLYLLLFYSCGDDKQSWAAEEVGQTVSSHWCHWTTPHTQGCVLVRFLHGWVGGWMDGWMDGWVDSAIQLFSQLFSQS